MSLVSCLSRPWVLFCAISERRADCLAQGLRTLCGARPWREGSPLGLPVVLGRVAGQAVQDEDLAPLGALVQGCEQLVDGLRVQVEQVAAGVRLGDLREGGHCVRHHLWEGCRRQRLRHCSQARASGSS